MNGAASRGLVAGLRDGSVLTQGIEISIGEAARRLLRGRPADDPLAHILAYWDSLCLKDDLPSRDDISPLDIDGAALPHILLIDVLNSEERRFRYRLVGTAVETIYGGHFTGRFMDEFVPGPLYREVRHAYDQVCEAREPVLVRGAYVRASGEFFNVSRIGLPLAPDRCGIDGILSAVAMENVYGTGRPQ